MDLAKSVLPMADSEALKYSTVDQSGWKLVHADVFRPPAQRIFFCSAVGAGVQLMVMSICVILIGCIEHYHHRGSVMSTMFYFYILSSLAGGYVSGNWYQRLYGDHWSLNMLFTSVIFAGPAFIVWSIANTVAIMYNSTAAFPFAYILLLFAGWICITIPLTVVGATVGRQIALRDLRRSDTRSYFPCRTNKLERRIPEDNSDGMSFFRSPGLQYFVCGTVPFLSIYVELHYILDSVWGLARYTAYGILLLATGLTLCNAALICILFLYVQLNGEDWRWWWRSFYAGFSIGAVFLLYCLYFFSTTHMDSFLQISFFFLYSLLLAYGMGLMLGSLTFLSASVFMNYIYERVKSD